MDLFNGPFKIQDMIDSDMRCNLDDYFAVLPGVSTPLSNLAHAHPMEVVSDAGMISDVSDDGLSGWMNCSHMFSTSSDLDSIGSIIVNPQTGLPISSSSSPPSSTNVSVTSSPFNRAVNLTLTPQSNHVGEPSTTTSSGVTVPVHIITTTTTLVTGEESKPSQVNLTVAVPTSETSPLKASKGMQVQHLLAFRKSIEGSEENIESPKARSKQLKNGKLSKPISNENSYPKPAYSYSCLIAMALKNSKTGSLPVNEIYDFMTENFPYFKTAPNGWKNSVRHNLSLNKCFEKIEKPTTNGAQRKGYLWALNPNKVEKMEEELQKWGSRDPDAIRKSMANPEKLELIEKGELHNSAEEEEEKVNGPEPNNRSFKRQFRIKEEPADSSRNADFSPLDAPVGMDPALPEFDLQKGIWENLCDDRLQFVGSSINPSSPKHASSNVTAEGNSLRATSPSNLPKTSFIRAKYIYSHSPSSSSELSSSDEFPTQPPMMEKTAVCDA